MKIMQNSTRRTMTEQKIQKNIMRTNNPSDQNEFRDIFVSQSSSQGNIQFTLGKNFNPRATASARMYKSAGSGFRKPAARKWSTAHPEEQSRLSGQQLSGTQQQLQQMATSAHTFSIFDNNSFFPKRVQNHKLSAMYKSNGFASPKVLPPVRQSQNFVIVSVGD